MTQQPKTFEPVNQVILTGEIGGDPAMHADRNGKPFVVFSLATTNSWKDKETGAWMKSKKPVWHSCFAFTTGTQKHVSFYQKGQRVRVVGELGYRDVQPEGAQYPISEAIIRVRQIDAAPLPKKMPEPAHTLADEEIPF